MYPVRAAAALMASTLICSISLADHNARPPRVYDLKNIEWHLSFDETLGTIEGDVTNTLSPLKDATKQIYFDSSKLAIKKITVNGAPAQFHTDEAKELLYVTLPKASGPRDTLNVRIIYTGRPEAGIYFIPAKRAFPAHTSVVYTQGEMIDQHYWLPTWDNPDDKTTWDSFVTVPKNYTVITNGRLIGIQPKGNDKVVHYRMDEPMSTYLISLIAGQYDTGDDGSFGKAPVRWNVPVGLDAMGKAAFGGTDKMIAFYSKQTGFDYPYAKFEQSAVPDYMFGGMENITAVTQTIDALFPPENAPIDDSEGLVLHELAHQWFGDTVTCEQWQHAWLNEGFATFMPPFYERATKGQDEFDIEREGILNGGLGGENIPICWTGYKEPIDEFFVDNIYSGGASRMYWLMYNLGEDKFWKGIKDYLNTYKYQPVTTQKFFDSMSKSSGVDLHTFMNEWFLRAGLPHITVKRDGRDLVIDQKAPYFTLNLPVWVLDGTTWVKKSVLSNSAEVRLALGDLAGKPLLLDPEVYLPAHISYSFDISPEDYMALYRNAPNAAARARMQRSMIGKLSADQLLALAKEEKNDTLEGRVLPHLSDDAYRVSLTKSSDPVLVNDAANVPGDQQLSDDMTARLRDLAENSPKLVIRETAVATLLAHLKDDTLAEKAWNMPSYDEGFRRSALYYFVRNDLNKAREMALGVLANPDSESLRQSCIDVLGQLKDKPGDRRVFNALAKVAQERSFSARNDAMNALAEYGDKAAIPYIQPLENNSMVFTRRTAQGAVQALGG